MQRLRMPFKRQMMLCGYKNPRYRAYWGYSHYGVDISTIQGKAGDDHNVYASGDGTVYAAGWDNSGGNIVVIIYPACLNHKTGEVYDLVARYMHLQSIFVVKGQTVKAGDKLGVEGNTKTGDYHLHLEFETDTKWPMYSPQVSARDDWMDASQGNLLRKGVTDCTVNPSFVLHRGAGQATVRPTYNPAWLNAEDFIIPTKG